MDTDTKNGREWIFEAPCRLCLRQRNVSPEMMEPPTFSRSQPFSSVEESELPICSALPRCGDVIAHGFKCTTVDCWGAVKGLDVPVSLSLACRLSYTDTNCEFHGRFNGDSIHHLFVTSRTCPLRDSGCCTELQLSVSGKSVASSDLLQPGLSN